MKQRDFIEQGPQTMSASDVGLYVRGTELHIIPTHETLNFALDIKSTMPHHSHVCDDVLLPDFAELSADDQNNCNTDSVQCNVNLEVFYAVLCILRQK